MAAVDVARPVAVSSGNADETAPWSARAAQAMPGGVTSFTRGPTPPIVWQRAEGAYLWDTDGQQYLDYHPAFGPQILGHNHPAMNARVKDAIDRLDCIGVGATDLEVQLAEQQIQHIPSAEAALFCNSGSEATMHAIRLARAFTGRPKIVKFQGCYHGARPDAWGRRTHSPPGCCPGRSRRRSCSRSTTSPRWKRRSAGIAARSPR